MSVLESKQFTEQELTRYAGQGVFQRGRLYFLQNRVQLISYDMSHAHLHVRGTHQYCVDISAENGELIMDCTCPYSMSGYYCKHMVSGGLFLREYLRKNSGEFWKQRLTSGLLAATQNSKPRTAKPFLLFFSLQEDYNGWQLIPYRIPAHVFPNGMMESEDSFSSESVAGLLENNPWIAKRAKKSRKILQPDACLNGSGEVVSLANVIVQINRMPSYYYYSYARPFVDYLPMLKTMGAAVFFGEENTPAMRSLNIHAHPARLKIDMQQNEKGISLQAVASVNGDTIAFEQHRNFQFISDQPRWVMSGREVFEISEDVPRELAEVFLETPHFLIPNEGEAEFLENYLTPLATNFQITGENVQWEDVDTEPIKRLYLSDDDGTLTASLRFVYGDFEFPYDAAYPSENIQRKNDNSWTLVRVKRAPELEENVYSSASSQRYGLKRGMYPYESGIFILRARVDPIDFLMRNVPRLVADGFEIFGEKDLKTAKVNRATPTISLTVSSGIDWFDVLAQIKFGDQDVALSEVRRALRKKGQYVKLADGTIGEIPDEWIEKYKHLFGLGEQTNEGVRLSTHHLTLIDQLLGDADRAQSDSKFRQRLEKLSNFSGIEPQEIPEGFTGELRPYQKAGYDWLHFLREYDFGGCLADDMGLGKTVQVLVFLQSLKERQSGGSATNLVVVPRSLLVNWQREAEKFTPGIRIEVHFGPTREKKRMLLEEVDILLTTYGTMRRDVQLLREHNFEYIVLDESQSIKNPLSQVSKASRLLRGMHRLVMTGTPVENSTFELWSQFAFLNPGLLGNLEYFKREFANPIQRQEDEDTAAFLRKMVYPFILRRTKKQVAPELPPRTEKVLYTDMETAQGKLYRKTRDYYRDVVMGLLEEQGIQNSRMKILEGLLRLRQISNHPRLMEESFRGKSGKFELLSETLVRLREEGHKALVFSQFVKMLTLVREDLDAKHIPYVYLDGQTRKRQEKVDEFQNNPDIPFFLISLRAGGVGLNLTAADYVIHIDPWWNPAVEMQATDRTHRIGQDKPVFVYKLIAKETVEEKILKLQERKKALVDQIISTDGSFFKDLTQEDVSALFS